MAAGEGDSEIFRAPVWQSFLAFRRGELVMPYLDELDEPSNPLRVAVVAAAKHLKAIIRHDAGDQILDW
jgi:hypothetical protein